MVQTRSNKLKMATDSLCLVSKENGSTSRVVDPSNSISESRSDIQQLPQELITEILVRLPVKSLLRFKCVSKPWLSLISDPLFISSHFSKSLSMNDIENSHLQLLFDTKTGMKKCSLYSALHDADPYTLVSDFELPPQLSMISLIVGIVNGLVCLCFEEGTDLLLWNPVLKKVKLLPPLNVSLEAPFNHISYRYGFGYDESVDDYKIICWLWRHVSEHDFEDEVKVYSLRADSWGADSQGTIDVLNDFYPLSDTGLFANSKIYWCGNVSSSPKTGIVSLDMASEEFREVQHPPNYEAGDYDLKLGVLSGRLCVLCDYIGRKADLWVMDTNHGDGVVEDSWSKVVSIPYVDVYPEKPYFRHWVLCILTNGDIVMANTLGLLVYNWKNNEFRMIELDVGISSYKGVDAYVESLVWPNYA